MRGGMAWLKNGLLVAGSLLAVFALSLATDRVVGLAVPTPDLPGTMELLFPPNSEHVYTTIDFTYTVRTNSLGLRERELPGERGEVYRIAAIGDSYTYGWGVEIEHTWLRLLEQHLKDAGCNVETVNMGKPGSGPPDYADLAERAIPILRPDLVIVALLQGNDMAAAGPTGFEEVAETLGDKARALYPNIVRFLRDLRLERDIESRTQEVRPPEKTKAEDNRRWAANTAKEFLDGMTPEQRARFDAFDDEVKETYMNGLLNPYMIDLAMQNEHFYGITLNLDDPWLQECIKRTGGHLKRIKKVARDYGARVVVVSIPEGAYVNKHACEGIRRVGYAIPEGVLESDAPDEAIARASEEAGLPFLNATDTFKQRKNEPGLFFELDGHLTTEGHRLYAEAIAPQIERLITEDAGK